MNIAVLLDALASIRRTVQNMLFWRIVLAVWGASKRGQSRPQIAASVVKEVQSSQRQVEKASTRVAAKVLQEMGETPPKSSPVSRLRPDSRAESSKWEDTLAELLDYMADLSDPPSPQNPIPREIARRIEDQIDEDLSAAQGAATSRTYERSSAKIKGYRRVVHPELSEGGSCGLCIVATTRVYYTPDLKPIHDHCHCTVLPITATHDPGGAINEDDLGKVYGLVNGSTTASRLKQLRLQPDGTLVRNPSRTKERKSADPDFRVAV